MLRDRETAADSGLSMHKTRHWRRRYHHCTLTPQRHKDNLHRFSLIKWEIVLSCPVLNLSNIGSMDIGSWYNEIRIIGELQCGVTRCNRSQNTSRMLLQHTKLDPNRNLVWCLPKSLWILKLGRQNACSANGLWKSFWSTCRCHLADSSWKIYSVQICGAHCQMPWKSPRYTQWHMDECPVEKW